MALLKNKSKSTPSATIAPLVLLSVVDHFKRVSADRVIGVLLGNVTDSKITITNSFAIPFEETEDFFFIDTSYLQNMYDLFYKVNISEKIIGWYHSGPKMCKNDLEISNSFSKYFTDPVLAIVDVQMEACDIPVQIYRLRTEKYLDHIDVLIGADETEEVGIEHLLRDIKEGTGSSIKDRVNEIKDSLKMYKNCLDQIVNYITELENGKKGNFEILENFQEILNEFPRFSSFPDLSRVYSAELVNTFIATQDLARNKIENK
jgi:26S proteasome regulatory subunit N8